MDFTEIATVFAIVSPVIWKLVDFFKYLRAKDTNASITQAIVWVAGIALLFLLAGTDFADSIGVGSKNLATLNASTLIFIGLAGGSLASVVHDFKKATDNTDSAAVPPLVKNETDGEHFNDGTTERI